MDMPEAEQERPVVLVIEDQTMVRDFVRDAVTGFGYDVLTAGSAGEALAALRGERPAVILLDIGLPDAAGTATLEWLRTLRPTVPVIVLTGHRDEALAREMLQRGAFAYITKPFQLEQLRRVLAAAVAGTG
jgi:DNA-binding response OmpR family regulator